MGDGRCDVRWPQWLPMGEVRGMGKLRGTFGRHPSTFARHPPTFGCTRQLLPLTRQLLPLTPQPFGCTRQLLALTGLVFNFTATVNIDMLRGCIPATINMKILRACIPFPSPSHLYSYILLVLVRTYMETACPVASGWGGGGATFLTPLSLRRTNSKLLGVHSGVVRTCRLKPDLS